MAHPTFYRDLLRRRFAGDPALTPAERRELDLHLLICPECNYDYARLLLPGAPEMAQSMLNALQGALSADLVSPYLRDLAQALSREQPLTGFQQLLWRFVCRDRDTMGRLRLLEAEARLRGG